MSTTTWADVLHVCKQLGVPMSKLFVLQALEACENRGVADEDIDSRLRAMEANGKHLELSTP